MNYHVENCLLLFPEKEDLEHLYKQKNVPAITAVLGSFICGYSRAEVRAWAQLHSGRKNEVLDAIRDREMNRCIGHGGLYEIDQHTRSCEFGIMICDRSYWEKASGEQSRPLLCAMRSGS